MDVITEKATQHSDLPHPYKGVGLANGECECGRMELDPLHSRAAATVEQASAGARLQTEKGV